ncbi:MAG: SUMF1/EgtB/PvdO family nonheme iron enzyme [Anaerolineales bacterium]|nr:SUMF1/EgtB/PvdO family nonheme iron enzyme [Anaerolineales bacterium]
MSQKRALFTVASALAVSFGLTLAGGYVLERVRQQSPLPSGIRAKAHGGVAANDEWEPAVRRIAGLEMVLVPSGCFRMGTTEDQLAEARESCNRYYGAMGCKVDFRSLEQPARRVCFPEPYWIGRFEVTNHQYGSSSSVEMFRAGGWPRETVTWVEANRFCEGRGMRLPTEAEWEFAARGPDSLIYPWGNEFDQQALAYFRMSPIRVGSFERGRSWVGAYDLSGSVLEWTADVYRTHSEFSRSDGPTGDDQRRVAKGGSWFSRPAFEVRAAWRVPHDPEFASSVLGFRCARDFE